MTAATSSGGRAATRSATRPRPGRTALGSRVSHGTSTKARSCARGCGRVSSGSSESTGVPSSSVTAITSTSRVRGPKRTSRVRPAACSSSCARASQPRGVARPADDDDRVEVGRLLDRPPRRGLVERRAGHQAVALQRGRWPRAACRRGRRGWTPSERTARRHRRRSRRMATVTSSNGTPSSACGLCTVTSTASTSGLGQADVGEPLRQRLQQVDRLAGEHGVQPLGQLAVVDGALEVVGSAAGRGVELEDGVDEEHLAALALERVDPVVAVRPQARAARCGRGRHGGRHGRLARPRRCGRRPRRPRRRAPGPPTRRPAAASTVVASVAASRSLGRAGRAVGAGEQPAEEASCGRPRPAPAGRARRAGRGRPAAPSCARRAWRTPGPGRARAARGRRRRRRRPPPGRSARRRPR